MSRSRSMPPGPARRARQATVLAVSLAIFFLAMGGFAWLAVEVSANALTEPNTAALTAIHAYTSPGLDPVATTLTRVGSVPVIALLTVIAAGLLLARARLVDAATLAVVMAGTVGLVEAIKHTVHEARPTLFPRLVQETGYSFPSGHATLSFALFGFLAAWLVLEGPRRALNWLGAIACLLVAAAIAGTRLYLAVHWPADVLAGALVGTGWVAACVAGRQLVLGSRGS